MGLRVPPTRGLRSQKFLAVVVLVVVGVLVLCGAASFVWRTPSDIVTVFLATDIQDIQHRHDAMERLERVDTTPAISAVAWAARHIPIELDDDNTYVWCLVRNQHPLAQQIANSMLKDSRLRVYAAADYAVAGDSRGRKVLMEHVNDKGPSGRAARKGLSYLQNPESGQPPPQ